MRRCEASQMTVGVEVGGSDRWSDDRWSVWGGAESGTNHVGLKRVKNRGIFSLPITGQSSLLRG